MASLGNQHASSNGMSLSTPQQLNWSLRMIVMSNAVIRKKRYPPSRVGNEMEVEMGCEVKGSHNGKSCVTNPTRIPSQRVFRGSKEPVMDVQGWSRRRVHIAFRILQFQELRPPLITTTTVTTKKRRRPKSTKMKNTHQ